MEPMASPTWSDLLQTIKEKKYRVSADYLLGLPRGLDWPRDV